MHRARSSLFCLSSVFFFFFISVTLSSDSVSGLIVLVHDFFLYFYPPFCTLVTRHRKKRHPIFAFLGIMWLLDLQKILFFVSFFLFCENSAKKKKFFFWKNETQICRTYIRCAVCKLTSSKKRAFPLYDNFVLLFFHFFFCFASRIRSIYGFLLMR